MKKLLLILLVVLFGCDEPVNKKSSTSIEIKKEKLMSVSFETGYKNTNAGIIVAYTNDADSLWLNEEWIKAIKSKMFVLTLDYPTVLLFNDKKNMPNVSTNGMNYSSNYDRYMVCGYWKYPNGNRKFCYGGVKNNGNFKKCK